MMKMKSNFDEQAAVALANRLEDAARCGQTVEEADDLRRRAKRVRGDLAKYREEGERVELLDDLLYEADRLPWTREELLSFDIAQLRRVFEVTFGERSEHGTATTDFDWVKPILAAPGERSALEG